MQKKKKKYVFSHNGLKTFGIQLKYLQVERNMQIVNGDECVPMFIEILPFKMGVFVNNKELVLKQCCLCIELRVKIILP